MEDKLNKKYKRIKLIGTGTFGKAWLVSSSHSRRSYVIKEITLTGMTKEEKSHAENEVAILSLLKHKNVIRYREAFTSVGLLHIVMEHADQGDLAERIEHRRINSGQGFPEERSLDWVVQISFALSYIHGQKILHRDLKPANIFLTSSRLLKIGDFGIAKMLTNTLDNARTAIGTPYYLSPEICRRQPYNQKSDIWALGCILYELVTLKHPFEANDFSDLVLNILSGVYPPVMSDYSLLISDLVSVLLRINPEKRPTAWQVLQVPKMRTYVINYTSRRNESMASLSVQKSTTSEGESKEMKSRKRLGGTSSECGKKRNQQDSKQKATQVTSEHHDIRQNFERQETASREAKLNCDVRESRMKTSKKNRKNNCNVKRDEMDSAKDASNTQERSRNGNSGGKTTDKVYSMEDKRTPSVSRRDSKIYLANKPLKASNSRRMTQKQKIDCASLPPPIVEGDKRNTGRTMKESRDERNYRNIACGETYVVNRRGLMCTSHENKPTDQGYQQFDGNVKKDTRKQFTSELTVISVETVPDEVPNIENAKFQSVLCQRERDLNEYYEEGHRTVVSKPSSPNRTMQIASVMHAGTPTSDEDTGSVRGRLESLRLYLEDKLGTVKCVSALKCLEETTESDKLVKLMNDRIGSSKMRYFPVLLQMWDLENRCH